jgi:hypothetical protein
MRVSWMMCLRSGIARRAAESPIEGITMDAVSAIEAQGSRAFVKTGLQVGM